MFRRPHTIGAGRRDRRDLVISWCVPGAPQWTARPWLNRVAGGRPRVVGSTPFIFIASSSRSGSTIFGTACAAATNGIHTGETRYLFERSGALASRERRCSCDKAIDDCEFWSKVQSAKGLASMYATIMELAGTPTVIDSSKHLRYVASAMRSIGANRCRVVHLVRDPRGHLASSLRGWNRRGKRNFKFKPTLRRAVHVGLAWQKQNRQFLTLKKQFDNYARVNYETFVQTPVDTLSGLLGQAVHSPLVAPVDQHVLAGNRRGVSEGYCEFTLDDTWKTLPPAITFATYLAAFPLSYQLGYRP